MRVSTDGDRQVLDLQRDALLAAGVDERHCSRIVPAAAADDRAGLAKALAFPQAWRLSGGLEAGPSRPIAAASADDGERPQGARHRVPLADRADGHHHAAGRIPVPCLRRAGAVRAVADPGAGAEPALPRRGAAAAAAAGPIAIDAEKLAAVIAALEGGATKAAVCRTFGIKRSTLINSLARIGWSAGLSHPGGMSDATTAIDRSPDRRAVRSADRTA